MLSSINHDVAERLEEVAQLLHDQGSNLFRVQAYRHAAETLVQLEKPVNEILKSEGLDGLKHLPAIGESIARAVRDLVLTGRLPMLERLRGETEPVNLLASVPGIGRKMAERLHYELAIDTLEDLELAAYDGRLSHFKGIGDKRLSGIISSLTERLGRVRSKSESTHLEAPSIEELLDVDREYREKDAANQLHKFAPRRFNPTGQAWLPVLHTERGVRHYTALFSNTARAHQKGKTHDWVILFYDDGKREWQCTVITGEWGILKGHRIVSGRESECLKYYEETKPTEPSLP
ncbi:helix-hairpin-helix domain-containing protein [Candidatus Nitrospira salsa]